MLTEKRRGRTDAAFTHSAVGFLFHILLLSMLVYLTLKSCVALVDRNNFLNTKGIHKISIKLIGLLSMFMSLSKTQLKLRKKKTLFSNNNKFISIAPELSLFFWKRFPVTGRTMSSSSWKDLGSMDWHGPFYSWRILWTVGHLLNLLHFPQSSTKFGNCSFSIAASTAWNSLSYRVKDTSSLETFKSQLKTHLFKQLYNCH